MSRVIEGGIEALYLPILAIFCEWCGSRITESHTQSGDAP
jgi:hypothetical protein